MRLQEKQTGAGGSRLFNYRSRILQLTGTSRVDSARYPVVRSSEALVPPERSLQARALSWEFHRPQPLRASPRVSVRDTPGSSCLQYPSTNDSRGICQRLAPACCLTS
ncbi:uncharacterized protein LOC119171475 [Rhipicephalus microplus]|uniref:uncharacterized protein LOC119171475 n=1 Tax=Rhipicephalus microplus TaxID=6941 RepID=UPI003F6D2443